MTDQDTQEEQRDEVERLYARTLLWIVQNPGKDAVDVARHFQIDLKLAVDVLDDLTAAGIIRDLAIAAQFGVQ